MVVIDKDKKYSLDFNKLNCIEDRLICRPFKHHAINEKGIIIPDTAKKDEFITLRVIKKGPLVKSDISEGDFVFIRCMAGVFMGTKQNTEDNHVIIRETEILTYIKSLDVFAIDNPIENELNDEVTLNAISPVAQA